MHKIRWSRGDAVSLGKAVARFNALSEAYGVGIKYNYQGLKEDILTRKELKRKIKSLKRLTAETASTYIESERKIEKKLALRALRRELKQAKKGNYMKDRDRATIEGEIRNIKNLDKLSESFRAKKIERISELARADYGMKEAENYRDWYIKTLEEYYSDFDGYDKLMSKLSTVTNGQAFYDKIAPYENESDIYRMRYGILSQEDFNKILRAWGLEDETGDYEEVYSGF